MSSLFKRKGLGPSQSAPYSNHEFADGERADGQVDELDDYHQDESAGYEHDDFDNEPHVMVEPQQSMPQPTQPMPMKKVFPTPPAPAASPATPVQPAAPATAPAPVQPATPAPTAPVARQTEAERRRDPKLIQITLKIDRVLHGRIRYMTFKTGLSQSEILEELIRTHCPEVP